VRNLCGTFCFSMQFVVFMDLLGTATLPVAIALTYSLAVSMILSPPNTFEKAIPLILLMAVIGLPAVLILITTRKVVYVFWMLIYLVALPIWNFVLPVYSFWHFDDFSWGETRYTYFPLNKNQLCTQLPLRKVEGERKGAGHEDGKADVNATAVPMRRWEDWERSRLRKLKRDDRRRKDMDRSFPQGYPSQNGELAVPRFRDTYSQADTSETTSLASSDEDTWGPQIGGYNEHSTAYPPPPIGLNPSHNGMLASGATLGRSFDAYAPAVNNFHSVQPPPREHVISPVSPFVPSNGSSSAVQWQTHAKKRSVGRTAQNGGGDYGPLGPLDPGTRL
jgi:chitin synthase